MKRHAGFTLIELLITITIMVILLTLSVVTLRSNQANARDEERKTDNNVIAQQLESYFRSGSDDAVTYAAGKYPPTQYMDTEAEVKLALRDLDPKVLRAPGVTDASGISLTVAANKFLPAPNTSTYVYQPLTAAGELCQLPSDECRKFTLYYQLETVPALQSIVSKNQ